MDGQYVIQGIWGDRVIYSDDCDEEKEAKENAEELYKDLTFEGDKVRVITRDGELVLEIPGSEE